MSDLQQSQTSRSEYLNTKTAEWRREFASHFYYGGLAMKFIVLDSEEVTGGLRFNDWIDYMDLLKGEGRAEEALSGARRGGGDP